MKELFNILIVVHIAGGTIGLISETAPHKYQPLPDSRYRDMYFYMGQFLLPAYRYQSLSI